MKVAVGTTGFGAKPINILLAETIHISGNKKTSIQRKNAI